MRVLFASTRGAGHFGPLVPFARACVDAGHEVLVAGPEPLAGAVVARGFAFWEFEEPAPDELGAIWSTVPSLTRDDANVVVIRDVFGRLNSAASVPRLRQACREWRPDVVVRENNQYGAALAAELEGIPHVRVATGLASGEDFALDVAAEPLDDLRRSLGLPGDPAAEVLRASPYLTLFPEGLEDPAAAAQPQTWRFRDPGWSNASAGGPGPWATGERPLVYVTLGSVAGEIPAVAAAYDLLVAAVGGLPVDVLLTVGHSMDLEAFADVAPNVHVERWVAQEDVLPWADAVVCHGGSGSTLGAVAHGLPLVVTPLFADQPANAARVHGVGAGIAVDPLEPAAVRDAVTEVLEAPAYRSAARALAAELDAHTPVAAAVELLAHVAAGHLAEA